MSQGGSFTFYSYARVDEGRDDRWAYTGIPEIFFYDEDSAREALRELREDVESEPESSWPPMQLEKIETIPISKESIFALLNDGVGAFVKSYEIIDVID
jgi:benzoyl-CoA reductase/2-hydroxyglutaryl-CoA dehydratase subunit BcrC/BadD/HgdB